MKTYKITFQNYVTKEETTETIEAKDFDIAVAIARDIRDTTKYFIILSIEEISK
jgi:hypothetical protein